MRGAILCFQYFFQDFAGDFLVAGCSLHPGFDYRFDYDDPCYIFALNLSGQALNQSTGRCLGLRRRRTFLEMLSTRIYQIMASLFLLAGCVLFAAGLWGNPASRLNGSSGIIGLSTVGTLIFLIGILVFKWAGSRKN